MSKFLEHKKRFVGQPPRTFIFIDICFHVRTYTHFRNNHRDAINLPLIHTGVGYGWIISYCVCTFFLAVFEWFTPTIWSIGSFSSKCILREASVNLLSLASHHVLPVIAQSSITVWWF